MNIFFLYSKVSKSVSALIPLNNMIPSTFGLSNPIFSNVTINSPLINPFSIA